MTSTEGVVVAEFKKNLRETVRAILRTWGGRRLIDIRTYYCTESGEWRPGPKGLCLRVELLADLKTAVEKLESAVEDEGLGA